VPAVDGAPRSVPKGSSGGGGAALTVQETDGSPSVDAVDKIIVNNGSLTDDGSGQITLDNTGPTGADGPTGPTGPAAPGVKVYIAGRFR